MHSALFAALMLPLVACRPEPPLAPDATPIEAPTFDPDTIPGALVLGGRFRGAAGHRAQGGVRVVIADGVARVTLQADFSASNVPDPQLYLNTEPDPNRGRPLRFARLRSFSGAQSYTFRVPADAAYTYVLLWCDRYNVGVGIAALDPPD